MRPASHVFELKKVTAPVLLHLLRDEIRLPRVFLWRCVWTLGGFKSRIESRFPAELVEIAALPLWVYINLKRKLGGPKAFEIMRVAVLTGGVAQWNLQFQTVEKPRTFANLCEQELLVNKTGFTRWNTLEVVERSERRFELKVTRCLYHELAVSLGVPETPVVTNRFHTPTWVYLDTKPENPHAYHRHSPRERRSGVWRDPLGPSH